MADNPMIPTVTAAKIWGMSARRVTTLLKVAGVVPVRMKATAREGSGYLWPLADVLAAWEDYTPPPRKPRLPPDERERRAVLEAEKRKRLQRAVFVQRTRERVAAYWRAKVAAKEGQG
jgi:hypothetical protein